MDLRLRFDLRDTGGPPGRQLRVGDSLVSFGVWAYASDDTGGSTVAVILPPGYDVEVPTGALPLRSTAADGRQVLRSGPIARPATFFYVVADRPGAYRESRLDVGVGGRSVDVMLRAWREDAAWSKRVGRLLTDALPVLGGAIGLPWPVDQPLVVQEAGNRPRTASPGCSSRPRAASRSPTTPTPSSSCTKRPTPGSTARSWPIAGRTKHSPRCTQSARQPSWA